ERILECRGTILFDEKVGEPCERVPDDKEKRKVVPTAGGDEIYEQTDAERGPDKVQPTGRRLAVLSDVKIPKFCVGRDYGPLRSEIVPRVFGYADRKPRSYKYCYHAENERGRNTCQDGAESFELASRHQ